MVGLLNKYESIVQDASREYDRHTKTYNKQVENVNTCLSAICDSCIEAEDIPQWKEHIFSKDRYEMSGDEGERLIGILSDIAGEQTDDWRKRSIPTHSEWLYPLTFDAGNGLKEA